MTIARLAAIALLLSGTASAQQVYKCSIAGKTTYQDRPCPGAPTTANIQKIDAPAASMAAPIQTAPAGVAVPAPTSSPIASSTPTSMREPPARPTGEALRKARMENRVMLGMTEHDVLEVAGKYSDHEVTSGADATGEYQIWVFRQRMEGFPLTIAFRQGVVVQYSDRDLPYLAY